MSRAGLTVSLVVPVLMVVTGCAAASGASGPGSSTQHKQQQPAAAGASASVAPVLTPTAPAGTSLGAGERVWAAFAQRGLSYDAWWARLRPLLSEAARAEYVYDDPRNLPVMTLTGKLRLASKAPGEPRYTAEVVVPTSKGVFGLDLERHTLTSPWLLYAIRFPSGVR